MTKLFGDVYRNKRVLIMGHTGFKGSWLSIWLKELGADVVGYALEPITEKDNFVVSKLSQKIESIIGDVRDFEKLSKVFEDFKPEFVFHLAAQSLVRLSYEEPKETYETNIIGAVNVLEAIRNTDSVKVGVLVTSDKCYENKEKTEGYKETDPMGGYDPYSASKGCSELVISSYRNSFFNPKDYENHNKSISSVRAGNVIGGGDWAKDRIVPDCIKSLENNEPILVRNPQAVRPWQYVLEPLSGYLLLGQKMYEEPMKYCGAWNFGPNLDSLITVAELTNLIIEYYGTGSWKDVSNPGELHETNFLALNCSKARNLLKWKPVLNMREAIRLTVDWYKKYKNQEDCHKLTLKEISEYIKKAEEERPFFCKPGGKND